ncbi:hypothetical protein PoB_000675000 [Plakobranchus ocellatus]|uniref:Uncharacterized protein n=1 Tax=Plakobranchus ocellatus TaxID=259542 RepID=A0AAV3YCJ8_9GAST|nr:hypothetical protein PoB_000675000 [Plakobranchus ocellatus]
MNVQISQHEKKLRRIQPENVSKYGYWEAGTESKRDYPGSTTLEEHRIEMTTSIPLRQRPYPVLYETDVVRQVRDGEFGNHQEEQFSLQSNLGKPRRDSGKLFRRQTLP